MAEGFRQKVLHGSVAFLDKDGSLLVPNASIVVRKKAITKSGFAPQGLQAHMARGKGVVARLGEPRYASGK